MRSAAENRLMVLWARFVRGISWLELAAIGAIVGALLGLLVELFGG